MEFLVEVEVRFPAELDADRRDELIAAEAERGAELARAGTIRAIWRVPGRLANRAVWSATDATALHALITSLPLWLYMTVDVTPLAAHPLATSCAGLPSGLQVA